MATRSGATLGRHRGAAARTRLRSWKRSCAHLTVMPVGMCLMRTAVSTLFTFWPPAPRRARTGAASGSQAAGRTAQGLHAAGMARINLNTNEQSVCPQMTRYAALPSQDLFDRRT